MTDTRLFLDISPKLPALKNADAVISAVLLGLFPALFLPVLQAMLCILIISICLFLYSTRRLDVKGLLTFPNVAFAQFALFFLINALVFDVVEGGKFNSRAVNIESWGLSLLCLAVLGFWLQQKRPEDLKRALLLGIPIGLSMTFVIATYIYMSGTQGWRIRIFTSGALTPPLWFLVLTMCSFTWFFDMSRGHKIWRIALFFLAGLMVIYSSARLAMLAWCVCSVALMVWIYAYSSARHRLWVGLGASFLFALLFGGLYFADVLTQSRLSGRMASFIVEEITYESIRARFVRLKIWSAALSVIAENPFLGIGKVNERVALDQELEWGLGFRAHQTYLSYLIAGGIPALISGLIMQSPALAFLSRGKRMMFFPAFLGLGVVITMNCLTDSVFQSIVNFQMFMVLMLVFLRVADLGPKGADV